MGLVPKNSETNPLNRVKNDQCQSETQIVQYGNGVRYKFFH